MIFIAIAARGIRAFRLPEQFLPQADLGSRVELWGREVSVNEVAQRAGTIAYELLCNVKRVRFEYRDSAQHA